MYQYLQFKKGSKYIKYEYKKNNINTRNLELIFYLPIY